MIKTSREFVYWLQGFFEVTNTRSMNEEQIAKVRAKLSDVFVHEIDPSFGDAAHQAKLNKAHNRHDGFEMLC